MPLPAAALSPRLAHTTIGFEQSYEYALRYPYKGVFIQSPYLLCLGFAWFLLRRDKKKFLLYSVSLAFAANLLPFLYLVYYSPNSYDTQFFISFADLLSPGFAVILEKVLESQKRGEERTLRLIEDYSMPNVSSKVLRIILSYTDYINRVVWKKGE